MMIDDYLAGMNNAGAYNAIAWETTEDPKAASRKAGVTLTKKVRAVVRAGIEYANLAENEGREEIGSLRWGHWYVYPWIQENDAKTRLYARVYVTRVTEVVYLVNGQEVAREDYVQHLVPSKREKKARPGGITTVPLENVRELNPAA